MRVLFWKSPFMILTCNRMERGVLSKKKNGIVLECLQKGRFLRV